MGFVKRLLPFIISFTVGLFIASFFVSIALPNFQAKRNWRSKHREYHRKIERENWELREANMRLKKRNAELERKNSEMYLLDKQVPPPPPLPAATRPMISVPYKAK